MVALHAPTPELTNRALDPSMESGVGGAQSTTADYPMTYDTGVFHSGTRSLRTDRAAANPTDFISVVNLSPVTTTNVVRIPVTAGEVVSAGVMIRCTVPGSRARITVQPRDAANANTGAISAVLRPFPVVGAWEWYVLENVTIPATSVYCVVQATVRTSAVPVLTTGGEQTWYDSVALFSGPTTYDYFDGGSPSASWTGTAHRSPSTRLSLPWQQWDGSKLVSLNQSGVWNGSAVVPQTFTDVAVA